MLKPNELKKGIVNLRDFLKKVAKKMPDKENRGFIDHMVYLNQVLDSLDKVLDYTDNPRLDYLMRLEQKYNKINQLLKKKLGAKNANDTKQ
tara:strand:+ start:121 stop:393 length:273 start_codon:yes stop_codon:yes gene_type:complete